MKGSRKGKNKSKNFIAMPALEKQAFIHEFYLCYVIE